MNKSQKKGILIASATVAVLALIYFGLGPMFAHHEVHADPQGNIGTLDPELFKGPAHEAYRIAREHPGLLAQLHCYCGCDRVLGHNNLLDCYRDSHGSRCAICVGEAIDAEHMYKMGTPVEQIRDALRQRYSRHES
jgi:Protein of unknown function with PCYCGC motif